MRRESFRALGTDCTIEVDGDPARLRRIVEAAERRWSRFRADSELTRLNRGAGRPVAVSAETFELVAGAVAAWHATAGRFDPTVLAAVVAAGYDRDLATITLARRHPSRPAPGCAGIELDAATQTITLPDGVALDLGGIAKGHIADLVVEAAGAAAVLVDLGGDVRVAGATWAIGIDGRGTVHLDAGAVATSSTIRRRWSTTDGVAHHLIDPATGVPTDNGLATVTVLAASAAVAEVIAKAALVAGPASAAEVVQAAGLTGVLVADDGTAVVLDGMEAFGWS